jgi:hypothetical protein
LSDPQLISFSKRFGELEPDPAPMYDQFGKQTNEAHPEIWIISNVKVEGKNLGSLGTYRGLHKHFSTHTTRQHINIIFNINTSTYQYISIILKIITNTSTYQHINTSTRQLSTHHRIKTVSHQHCYQHINNQHINTMNFSHQTHQNINVNTIIHINTST